MVGKSAFRAPQPTHWTSHRNLYPSSDTRPPAKAVRWGNTSPPSSPRPRTRRHPRTQMASKPFSGHATSGGPGDKMFRKFSARARPGGAASERKHIRQGSNKPASHGLFRNNQDPKGLCRPGCMGKSGGRGGAMAGLSANSPEKPQAAAASKDVT